MAVTRAIIAEPRQANRIAVVAKIAVTLALLFFLLGRTTPADLWNRMRTLSLPVAVLCCIALYLSTVTTAYRWKIVLHHMGEQRGLAPLWRYTNVAAFFNQFLPSGMGGDLFRVWYAHASAVPLGKALASVVVDRMLGLLAVAIFAVCGLSYLMSLHMQPSLVNALLFAMLALAMVLAAFLYMDSVVGLLNGWLVGTHLLAADRKEKLLAFSAGIGRTAAITRGMLSSWPDGAIALALSLLNQFVASAVVFVLARSMGASVSIYAAVVLFPYVALLSMLPISVAGWGIRESAMVVILSLLGVPESASLSVSLLLGLCMLTASLPGLFVWIALRKSVATGMSLPPALK